VLRVSRVSVAIRGVVYASAGQRNSPGGSHSSARYGPAEEAQLKRLNWAGISRACGISTTTGRSTFFLYLYATSHDLQEIELSPFWDQRSRSQNRSLVRGGEGGRK
jgi:hypothetical protein